MLINVAFARSLRPKSVQMAVGWIGDHLEVVVVGVARLGIVAKIDIAGLLRNEDNVIGAVDKNISRGLLFARSAF